ncbi:MAG: hypothetical protein ACREE6_15045, partial [Limisphaerales bacterium]
GLVSVNGGALAGTGAISGSLTINSGGTLAPGAPLGTLTISNNLALDSGSITIIQAQHLPLTNSALKVSGALTEGGTLIVTNSNSSSFAAGDSFRIFEAGAYSGAFGNFVLPPLSPGLAWNTSALNQSGALSVVQLSSPVITSVKISAENLVISGAGGPQGLSYDIEVATNLLSPHWTTLATNQFDSSGNFTFTNVVNFDRPQSYYRLQSP